MGSGAAPVVLGGGAGALGRSDGPNVSLAIISREVLMIVGITYDIYHVEITYPSFTCTFRFTY